MKKSTYKQKIKAFLYFVFYYTGLLHLSIMLLKKVKKEHSVIVLNYHRIVNEDLNGFLFKSAAIHHNAKLFEREMSFITRWFTVISMDELIAQIKKKKGFNTPCIAITFDDGYRDNYTLAYPVLKQFDLPATIYTISGLIGTTQRTWLDTIDYVLLKTKEKKLKFPPLFGDEILDIHSIQDKQKANNRIGEKLKRVDNKIKFKLIDELFDTLKVNRDFMSKNKPVMLNWEEVKEMAGNNISFGAHTHSHPILTQMPPGEAKHEIAISKNTLENELHAPVKHFAFPNGTTADFNEELRQFCVELGFKSIATGTYGINNKKSDPFFIKRMVPYVPFYAFASEIVRMFWRKT